jgi:HK97 gp10 family phage protein
MEVEADVLMARYESKWESDIPKVIARASVKAGHDVDAVAQIGESVAKIRSRVDTGQMRDGWHAQRTGTFSFRLENSVEHTIYNEYGTTQMSAQPMLGPAIAVMEPLLRKAAGNWYEDD